MVNTLSEQLKRIRKEQRLTLDQLSALSGVNRATISAYETQRYIPNIKTAAQLLDALGYELSIQRKRKDKANG